MELKLLTVLALFAVCGIVQARQVTPDYCDTICRHQREGSSARNVVRGKKHRASRSKGHLAPASRQNDYDVSSLCASCYGWETTGTSDRVISSRQSQSFPASIVSTAMQIPEEVSHPVHLLNEPLPQRCGWADFTDELSHHFNSHVAYVLPKFLKAMSGAFGGSGGSGGSGSSSFRSTAVEVTSRCNQRQVAQLTPHGDICFVSTWPQQVAGSQVVR
ncbi:uncharacterized protein LOC126101308 [Schistocerca cancellata]|uniref:uncharacterized protein LOC126101308 n=1 Tax=Schistocerca cancellata TaxID=274614 RepID=UPI0021199E7E|nr:uncharacterized protein LOC126101308 [Schistocerca cancellata]